MVSELRDSKNEWHAMVADGPPTFLQNELEKTWAKIAFEEATSQCDPARIWGCLPLAFPQTHPLEVPIPGSQS